jgi:hypothetical protein
MGARAACTPAAETVIGEDKSAVTDAGPSHGPILRVQAPQQAD